jgi:hypothetical protein
LQNALLFALPDRTQYFGEQTVHGYCEQRKSKTDNNSICSIKVVQIEGSQILTPLKSQIIAANGIVCGIY